MLWELPVMYGVLSVHLEINVQNKRLLYLLPILDFDPGTQKKAQGMPARWKAWNQFSRPLQSRLLVAGGGHPRARQGKSLVPLLSTPFLSSHRGTVPYLSRFQFCAGRYTNSQAGHTHTHTHTHTLLWPCPRVDAAQNVVRLSVERRGRGRQTDTAESGRQRNPQPPGSHMPAAVPTLHPQTTT